MSSRSTFPTQPGDSPASRQRAAKAPRQRRMASGTQPPPTTAAPEQAAPWQQGTPRDATMRQSFGRKLLRRIVTTTALFLATGIYLALLPIGLIYGLVADTIRRRPQLIARFHLTIASCLVWQIVGEVALFVWWIAGGRWLGHTPKNWLEWHRKLEGFWGHTMLAIPDLFYGMRTEVLGEDCLQADGPLLVLSRHTSVIDTMLPCRLLDHRNKLAARIVMKRELLFAPGIDCVAHRVPHAFVRRGSDNHERELKVLRKMAIGMRPRDAIWMYPEGTRFTAQKRRQVLAKLAKTNPAAAKRAETLAFTLPPRAGGTLALLEACRGMDVVFCAHTGWEGAGHLENLIQGTLYRRKVKVQLWRVPAKDIPADEAGRLAWLHAEWRKLDNWVRDNQDADLTELLRHQ